MNTSQPNAEQVETPFGTFVRRHKLPSGLQLHNGHIIQGTATDMQLCAVGDSLGIPVQNMAEYEEGQDTEDIWDTDPVLEALTALYNRF